MQRSAVWRPKQVVDLWDSLMRGLPLGLFYLVERAGTPRDIPTLTGRTKETSLSGFDLLDGQQRVRALLIGVFGFPEEKRCLWVDLEAAEGSQLRITSKAQPFGYNARTGNKLSLDERRRARRRIEPEERPLRCGDGAGGLRPAYDHELFDSEVIQNGERIIQPPLPYEASEQTFKLHDLLGTWRRGTHCGPDEGVAALRAQAGNGPSAEALETLDQTFRRIENAEVALLRVDPATFRDSDADTLELFERIGAGGTPLSVEERLYSIYKSHAPYIRNAVDEIHCQVGRVLSPTKIAATAIRIANAQTDLNNALKRNDTPDVAAFAKAMRDQAGEFRNRLNALIPAEPQQRAEAGALLRSFRDVKCLLSFDEDAGDFWIPDVMLASLPAELWQVLTFWAVNQPAGNPKSSREEAVRFALFWHLCVSSNDKAARWAFAHIKTINAENAAFPGNALYERFVGTTGDDRCANSLISPEEFERKLCKPSTPEWRTDAERFVEDSVRNDIGSEWWWNGKKILPWLQRDYIKNAFPGYAPLTDHEDDVPYDVDHICPHNDWREDWRTLRGRLALDERLKQRMYRGRDAVGQGIGNLRLIESSQNRSDQDADVADKMPWVLCHQPPATCDAEAMKDSAFAPEHRELWRKVCCPVRLAERKWNQDRLQAFQHAVEVRAAWLYRRFHDDLGYDAWTAVRADNLRSE